MLENNDFYDLPLQVRDTNISKLTSEKSKDLPRQLKDDFYREPKTKRKPKEPEIIHHIFN